MMPGRDQGADEGFITMQCPKCFYELKESGTGSCPKCGAGIAVVACGSFKLATWALYIGIAFIAVFCVAQTVWFWRESNVFNMLVASGGHPDPAQLAADMRVARWARYASNLSLGIGMTCIAVALFQLFHRVVTMCAQDRSA